MPHRSAMFHDRAALMLLTSTYLALAGCSANKQAADLLLPPSGQLQQQAAQLSCGAGSADKADPSKCPPKPQSATQSATQPSQTGALPQQADKAPGQQFAAAATTTPPTAPDPAKPVPQELYIDFQPDSVTLSDKEKSALREAVAARALSGWSRVSISAARGGTGNQFDQAVVAQKRARVVNEIIPIAMIELVEFDPTLPEDTVRLEFKRPPAKS
jgi:hypothetical protein